MFFIKIRIKGYLENITEKTKEIIDTNGIKNKNNISYISDDTKYKITILDNKILFVRDNKEFTHKVIFEPGKDNITEYYIKEYNTSIDISIQTTNLIINDNKIEISYITCDNKYNYIIEMSEYYEYKKAITRNNKREPSKVQN